MGLSFFFFFYAFSIQRNKTLLKNKHGEFWSEVKNAVLFSVIQYQGYKDQHYICFHTSSICMYHQGKENYTYSHNNSSLTLKWCSYYLCNSLSLFLILLTCSGLVDGGLSVSDIKLPCRTRPHWLEPTIYQSEAPPERSSTPSECIGLEARSMVSVAVKISSQNAERNVKVEFFTLFYSLDA